MPPLENRRSEVDVVNVERRAVDEDVDPLHPARLAGLPRKIVLEVRRDRQPAEHGIAEVMTAELPRRGHHPAHPEHRADFFGMPAAAGPGADHFLQRHDVGADVIDDLRNPVRAGAAVQAAATMDVVGGDAERTDAGRDHWAMIVRRGACIRAGSRCDGTAGRRVHQTAA